MGAEVINDKFVPLTSPLTRHFKCTLPFGGIFTFFDARKTPMQSVSSKLREIKSTITPIFPTVTSPSIASRKDETTISVSPEHTTWVSTLNPIMGLLNLALVTTNGTGNFRWPNVNSKTTAPFMGTTVLFAARNSTFSSCSKKSVIGRRTASGAYKDSHSISITLTWLPVSHNTLVVVPSSKHLNNGFLPINLTSLLLNIPFTDLRISQLLMLTLFSNSLIAHCNFS